MLPRCGTCRITPRMASSFSPRMTICRALSRMGRNVRYPSDSDATADIAECLRCADCVEKLTYASERERLIQDQVSTRNNDSRTNSPRFFSCKFPFHSARSATFSTQSASSRHPANENPGTGPGLCISSMLRDQAAASAFRFRRHQPSRPPPASSRPGRPAPAMGPGTAEGELMIPGLN